MEKIKDIKQDIIVSGVFLSVMFILFLLKDCGVNILMILVSFAISIAGLSAMYITSHKK